jgi:hypothetical protein
MIGGYRTSVWAKRTDERRSGNASVKRTKRWGSSVPASLKCKNLISVRVYLLHILQQTVEMSSMGMMSCERVFVPMEDISSICCNTSNKQILHLALQRHRNSLSFILLYFYTRMPDLHSMDTFYSHWRCEARPSFTAHNSETLCIRVIHINCKVFCYETVYLGVNSCFILYKTT